MAVGMDRVRRRALRAGAAWTAAVCTLAAPREGGAQPVASRRLDAAQTVAFRAWFVAVVMDQVQRPSPRWVHRDCAGLVRFAAREALRPHDARWQRAMGWPQRGGLPPDVALQPDQLNLATPWQTKEGQRSTYASALSLVQHNTRPVGRTRTAAQPGDLLFFDQGDDQHLMVWTGRVVAYHTGAPPTPQDPGLRWQRWERLMNWPDTRWRPAEHNANFAGLFRFAFLADAG